MNTRHTRRRATALWALIALLVCMATGCAAQGTQATSDQAGAGTPAYTSFAELEHAKIGVATGSVQERQASERFPDAELSYFSNDVDMLNALRAGKIDAFADAEPLVRYMMVQNPDLTYLDEWLSEGMNVGAIFPKTERGQALCDELSSFIRESKQNGVFDEIHDTWYGDDEEKRVVPDYLTLPATKGTLRMASDTGNVPYVYIKDGQPVGIDVDMIVRFCKARGYALEVVPMDFAAIVPAVVTGKVDFGCGCIAYTTERAESVLYSEFTDQSHSVIAVLKTTDASQPGFWESLKGSFERTFIKESRWKLFAEGIVTTLQITILVILFGTALGFGVFMICRKGNPVANAVTRFCVWLVQGLPAVVLLMILYYIIFGQVAIPGTVVAVVGFTLVFGASVYGMVKAGVGAIDTGQMEAAYTLGYSDLRAFFRIILPQALPHFMPAYKGEITAIIKATAVVGYITVQDLTKMGDIVRSRTYEAFFPLIAVAVFYFILAAILKFIVNRIERRLDPRQRTLEDIRAEVEGQ